MLSFDLVNFICMIINILILFFIAKKFLFGRVNAIIAKRQEEINLSYSTADKVTKEAKENRREYQMQIAELEKDKSDILDKAMKEASCRTGYIGGSKQRALRQVLITGRRLRSR